MEKQGYYTVNDVDFNHHHRRHGQYRLLIYGLDDQLQRHFLIPDRRTLDVETKYWRDLGYEEKVEVIQ